MLKDFPNLNTHLLSEINNPSQSDSFEAPQYNPEDIAIIQFTSGSTSAPKGVMLSNKSIVANLAAINSAAETNKDDVMISWLPLYHDMGLIGFLTFPMAYGIELVTSAPNEFLSSPLNWMEWVDEYSGTATAGPNFSYALAARALSKSKKELDLSSLRIALNGAEPVDPKTVRKFVGAGKAHKLNPDAVFPAFGMAELCIAGSFPEPLSGMRVDKVNAEKLETQGYAEPDTSDDARELVYLGKPVAGLEFRIVDPESSKVLGDRFVGELQVSGSSVTDGYFDNPEATAELFDNNWLKTGDLAYMVDGELILCGRLKDLIIIGGRNIYPQDIERVVGSLDKVRNGNVIAFSDDSGSKEKIVVVAETKSYFGLSKLKDQIKSTTLTTVGVPASDVVLVRSGTLPKTSSGKLQRSKTKRDYLNGDFKNKSV